MVIRKSRAPTLVDIAREAQVSLKTASRVLNQSANVRKEKIERVRAAMARLGYRPNELARSLMTRKSSVIGMVVANLANPFIINVIKEVQQSARANGHVVIVTSSNGSPDVERSEIESLVRRQIDGLIIAPAITSHDTLRDLLPPGLPTVTFDQLVRGAKFDSVTITNRQSAREATQHLLRHGYKNAVAVGIRPHLFTTSERVAGYREAMREASLEPKMSLVKHESRLTTEWLRREVFQRLQAEAIFSLHWSTTVHVLRGLHELDKRAGRDIPLIAFDDFILGDVLSPQLSVVQQPSEMLGRESARLLFDRLLGDGRQPARAVVLPARLVIRESCGCVNPPHQPKAP